MSLTALQIIQQAAVELGLSSPTTVASSTEATGQQLLAFLNSAGRDLVIAHTWASLNHTHTITVSAGVNEYALPSNYGYYIDQTFWDSTNRLPLIGPLSPQEWQQLVAGIGSLVTNKAFRPNGVNMQLFPTPSAGDVSSLSYQYITNHWVQDGATPTTHKEYVTADIDVPLLDSNLLVKFVKVKMWAAKGLDTTNLVTELTEVFNSLTGKDKGARVLSLSPRRNSGLLGASNLPEGNW